MACSVPTCAQGSSVAVNKFVENVAFGGFRVLQGFFVYMGGTLLIYSFVSTGSGLCKCGYRRARPLGGGRWRHCFRSLLGVSGFHSNAPGNCGVVVTSRFVTSLVRVIILVKCCMCRPQ